jgi:hypothetical protein
MNALTELSFVPFFEFESDACNFRVLHGRLDMLTAGGDRLHVARLGGALN